MEKKRMITIKLETYIHKISNLNINIYICK